MKHKWLAFGLVTTGVVVLLSFLWFAEGPIWRLIMLKRVPLGDVFQVKPSLLAGWATVKRLDPTIKHGRAVGWNRSSGYISVLHEFSNNRRLQSTAFHADGSVAYQVRPAVGGLEFRRSAPWWNGIQDQNRPTAPWIRRE